MLGAAHMLSFDILSAAIKGSASNPTSTIVRRSAVILRFEKFLQANRRWPVSYDNICAALGVSGRSLRAHCHDLLGVSPMAYVRRKRLRMARAALLRADPATASVTRIAIKFGFSELGRFSVELPRDVRRAAFGDAQADTETDAEGNQQLYPVSTPSARCWSEWQDLNLRPSRPERGAQRVIID